MPAMTTSAQRGIAPAEIAQLQGLERNIASLLIYQAVFSHPVGQAFWQLIKILQNPTARSTDSPAAYGKWFYQLASHQQSWQEYLLAQVLKNENPFTQQAQQFELTQLPTP